MICEPAPAGLVVVAVLGGRGGDDCPCAGASGRSGGDAAAGDGGGQCDGARRVGVLVAPFVQVETVEAVVEAVRRGHALDERAGGRVQGGDDGGKLLLGGRVSRAVWRLGAYCCRHFYQLGAGDNGVHAGYREGLARRLRSRTSAKSGDTGIGGLRIGGDAALLGRLGKHELTLLTKLSSGNNPRLAGLQRSTSAGHNAKPTGSWRWVSRGSRVTSAGCESAASALYRKAPQVDHPWTSHGGCRAAT